VFRQIIEGGVTECGQIAQEIKVSPATVSRFAKKAIDAGWIKKRGRNYELIETQKREAKNENSFHTRFTKSVLVSRLTGYRQET
jgi:Mn-dependent DtxR family transcriptional regulator